MGRMAGLLLLKCRTAIACGAIACAGLPAAAQPVVLYPQGDGGRFALGEPIRVTTRLLQVQISPDLVLSAAEGAEFSLDRLPLSSDYTLQVSAAPALLVNLSVNTLTATPPGTYRLGTSPPSVRLVTAGAGVAASALPSSPAGLSYGQGYLLADYLMVNQGRYLTVSTKTLNSFLASLLRSLIGRGQ